MPPAAVAPKLHPVITDKSAIAAAGDYETKRTEIKALGEQLDALKATIMAAMKAKDPTGEEKTMVFGNHLITRKDIEALPTTKSVKITPAMVGQVMPGKKGKAGYSFIEVQ